MALFVIPLFSDQITRQEKDDEGVPQVVVSIDTSTEALCPKRAGDDPRRMIVTRDETEIHWAASPIQPK